MDVAITALALVATVTAVAGLARRFNLSAPLLLTLVGRGGVVPAVRPRGAPVLRGGPGGPAAAAAVRRRDPQLAGRLQGEPPADRVPLGRAGHLHRARRGAGDVVAAAGARSPRRSRSAPSWHRRTRWPPRPSRAGSACPGASSRCSRASRWSTTRPRWCACGPPSRALAVGYVSVGGVAARLPPGRARRGRSSGSSSAWLVGLVRKAVDRQRHRHLPVVHGAVRRLPACRGAGTPPASWRSSSPGCCWGTRSPVMQNASSRLSERINWSTIQFLLENSVFLLIGLQVRWIVADVSQLRPRRPARSSRVCLAVLAHRHACCGRSGSSRCGSSLIRRRPGPRRPACRPGARRRSSPGRACAGWSRWRPSSRSRRTLPQREVLVLIAMVVTAGTLVLQGFSLPVAGPSRSACTGPTRARTPCRRPPSCRPRSSAGMRALDECADEIDAADDGHAAPPGRAARQHRLGAAGQHRLDAGDAERGLPAGAPADARGRACGGAAHPRRRGGRPRGARRR